MGKIVEKFTVLYKLLIIFGFMEFLWVTSISYNKQFVGLDIVSNHLKFDYSLIYMIIYYALYSFVIALLSQYGINKYGLDFEFNFKFLFPRIFTLAIILRIIINIISILLEYFMADKYVIKNTLQFSLEVLYIIILFHNCFLLPLRKARKLKLSLKEIYFKKNTIFIFLLIIFCSIVIILIYSVYSNEFLNYVSYNIAKYTSADKSYLQNSLIYKQKFFMGACLTLISCIFYLLFILIYRNFYYNYLKKKEKSEDKRISAKVIPYFTLSLAWLIFPVLIFAAITTFILTPLYPYFCEGIYSLGDDTFITIRDRRLPTYENTVYNLSITNVIHIYERDERTYIPLGEKRNPTKSQHFGLYFYEIPCHFIDGNFHDYDADTSYFVDSKKINTPYVGVGCYLEYPIDDKKINVIYLKNINNHKKDENLTQSLEQLILLGHFDIVEYSTKYLLKYDSRFIIPILVRYSEGEFTQLEKEVNKDISEEFIINFGKINK